MEEKRKKFGVEMLPSLHKRLKGAALDRDVNLYEVVEEAVLTFLDEDQTHTGPEARIPRNLRPCIGYLAEVLASGDADGIELVTRTIDVCRDRLRDAGARKEH